ncbi:MULTISPECIES: flagellar motor stator protein MotA [unclassified Exiguobacterium]|uniref:flagellar motor stator protein MotA n=1 Tax=unclassified Exiguobacterium TaxID=2644629 RepID=UPI000B58C75B|nr:MULTISPECIES: flagellar motor stator protein MotA [unclassified Exiguobacterium]ASI36661.1 flagellar motor protein MotA [Exiguobacterium sp. N4-1P]
MDIVSIIGIILGLITLVGGMILKGAPPIALLNPAALVIIFAGTAAAIMISFPKERLKLIPALFKVIFFEQNLMTKQNLMLQFLTLSTQARKEGLLSLETAIEEVDNAFMKRGVMMVIDGQPSEYVEDVMTRDLENMTERHHANANIFTQAGTYAPTLGVLGAVIGLVAALSDLSDIEKLGHAISGAFIATLFGIFTGYVLWFPFATKLKQKSANEIQLYEMIIEGILSIQNGESPKNLEDKLLVYLTPKERETYEAEKEAA